MEKKEKRKLSIPPYTLGEELWNAISHGIGALLAVAALVLMLVRARGALAVTAAALFGASLILLYAMSCLYHALSPRTEGKKVLRVLDHCNVFLLVFDTYIPVALLGVPGARGWILFGAVALFTVLGVVFTAVDLERFQAAAVLCELLSGWSILIGFSGLRQTMGPAGLAWLIAGGVLYSIGALLYSLDSRKCYRHSVFHFFCLAASFCHFWAVYAYLL